MITLLPTIATVWSTCPFASLLDQDLVSFDNKQPFFSLMPIKENKKSRNCHLKVLSLSLAGLFCHLPAYNKYNNKLHILCEQEAGG